ncbi:Ribosomal protein L11 methyltransferase (chromatophore) [Paulinella micropora]|uniref:ETFB lysine methyltransferase n=1 Tax=Paulinella micropora TaxID=1928728 RepID=A0A1L5YCM5_9EUKA|nr:ribosomal protein L11 methyltransferase [Paulinella micropora]AQX45216.1 ribosomal protein L11 methyltransferase [Paulinella micropora]BBL86435.1 Ribosomal protein L11 methyltransferase [Paulinella micropora]
MHNHGWWQLEMIVPRELEESLIWKLDSLGIDRIAIAHSPENPNDLQLLAWLPIVDWPDSERELLNFIVADIAATFSISSPDMIWSQTLNEDWSRKWKENWQPDRIGNYWLIIPSWFDSSQLLSGNNALRLDPGSAFGTGSHPTTRLCLEALEKLNVQKMRVADLGCGSGILSLGALLLGATTVVGCDTDPLAVKATYMNIALNGYVDELKFQVGLGSIDTLAELLLGEPADLLLCNTLASVITNVSPLFDYVISPNGRGLLSGLLLDEIKTITKQLESLNWQVRLINTKGKWGLLEIDK